MIYNMSLSEQNQLICHSSWGWRKKNGSKYIDLDLGPFCTLDCQIEEKSGSKYTDLDLGPFCTLDCQVEVPPA